jgi:hypothetical protein
LWNIRFRGEYCGCGLLNSRRCDENETVGAN